jgi:hypothetical protein
MLLTGIFMVCAAVTANVLAQPHMKIITAPGRHAFWLFSLVRAGFGSALLGNVLWAAPLAVDLTSREQSRQFFRAVYGASESVPMGFTGDVAASQAGDTSAAFKEAVRLRVNFFRAFAGIPGEVQFAATLNAKCQQAALMGSLNNVISHYPAASARGYTANGAEACGKSNLALLETGPSAITGYVRDEGAGNRDVGHRRWLFYPQTRQMGTGDVPASASYNATNALWILDETNYTAARPTTRDPFIAWPPAGYVPHTLVFPRWSLSVAGANFSQAFVNVKRGGSAVPVAVGGVNNGYGENTIVWSIDNQDANAIATHERPASDVTYSVEVTNVQVAGSAQSYRYTVTVYDPDTTGPGGLPLRLAGPAVPVVGQANTYSVTAPSYLGRLQWRSLRFSPVAPRFDAEGGAGLGGLIADTNVYDPVVTDLRGAGAASFRLMHPIPVKFDQILAFPDTYYAADASATLTFLSRLGYATPRQVARVQVSTDDGVSWSDLYRQAGDSTSGEQAFRARVVSLAGYEKRAFRVRFNFTYTNGGTRFSQTDPGVGWYLDDLVLTGVSKVSPSSITALSSANFSFTPSDATEVGLQVRGLIDVYPSEWSSVLTAFAGASSSGTSGGNTGGNTSTTNPAVTPPSPPTGNARLVNLSVRTTAGRDSAALVVGFNLTGSASKPMLIRGIGPTLGMFGVVGALADPVMVLKNSSGGTVLENDNWGGAAVVVAAAGRLGAFALDASSRDSVALPALTPGAYTATVTPANAATTPGIALVELYDADPTAGSRLTNVSTRALVGTGNEILVVGFAVSGSGTRNLLIRAIGPTLAAFGVTGTLADPKLEIYQNGALIRASDNWDAGLAPLFATVGAFPLTTNSTDAALALALSPGTYTAQVSGVGNTAGVALVEVYELP